MKKLSYLLAAFLGSLWIAAAGSPALAQNATVASTCGTQSIPTGYGQAPLVQDTSGNLCAKSAAAAVTTGGATPYHIISAATTNSTLISTGAHTLYSLTVHGLNTTVGYVRLYDTAAAPTCSSATGAVHTYAVIGSATQEGGLIVPLPSQGEAYATGLSFCITGGSADTDNTAGPVGIIVNASYK